MNNPHVPIRISPKNRNQLDLNNSLPALNGIQNNAYETYNRFTTPKSWTQKK